MEVRDESSVTGSLLLPEIVSLINLKKALLLEELVLDQPETETRNSDTRNVEDTIIRRFSGNCHPCSGLMEQGSASSQTGPENPVQESSERDVAVLCAPLVDRIVEEVNEHISGSTTDSAGSMRRTLQYSREELLGIQSLCENLKLRDQLVTRIGSVLNELNDLKVVESKRSSDRSSYNRPHHEPKSEAEAILATSFTRDVIWDMTSVKTCTQAYDVIPSDGCESDITISTNHMAEYNSVDVDPLDDSEDDMDSFQQRAFLVSGEPNFESGPPEDGFEYLRRVRWEAAQCPKVKVAKIAPEKLVSDQTCYLPDIPEIPRCDPKLLPCEEWEREFLSEFGKLRMDFFDLSQQSVRSGRECLPHFRNEKAWKAFCFGSAFSEEERESSFVSKEELAESCMSESEVAEEDECLSTSQKVCHFSEDEIVSGAHLPSLTIMQSMDEVSRAALFQYHVTWLDDVQGLPENRALWLFALAVAVDKPLDAQTSAAFRTLWRRCATIRASKLSEDDKELHMLNVLITISGQYFGQADNPC